VWSGHPTTRLFLQSGTRLTLVVGHQEIAVSPGRLETAGLEKGDARCVFWLDPGMGLWEAIHDSLDECLADSATPEVRVRTDPDVAVDRTDVASGATVMQCHEKAVGMVGHVSGLLVTRNLDLLQESVLDPGIIPELANELEVFGAVLNNPDHGRSLEKVKAGLGASYDYFRKHTNSNRKDDNAG